MLNINKFTCGKSWTAAWDICILESSFFVILYARIVFETPKPAIKDLKINVLNLEKINRYLKLDISNYFESGLNLTLIAWSNSTLHRIFLNRKFFDLFSMINENKNKFN